MRITSLVPSTFFPFGCEIGEKSRDKTRHRRIVQPVRIQWRVHNAAHTCTKSALEGCIRRAERWPRNESGAFSLVSLSVLRRPARRHPRPRPFPTPCFRLPRRSSRRLRNRCAAVSPIEMHRFHYKLLMRQICLSVSDALSVAPLYRVRSLSPTTDNNIWATYEEPNGRIAGKRREEKKGGSVPDRCWIRGAACENLCLIGV